MGFNGLNFFDKSAQTSIGYLTHSSNAQHCYSPTNTKYRLQNLRKLSYIFTRQIAF